MKVLVALCAVAVCAAAVPYAGFTSSALAPLAVHRVPYTYNANPALTAAPLKTQYVTVQISYGCSEPCQAQNVVQDTSYDADVLGYHVTSNESPAPLIQPVQDSPKVAEDKAIFFSEFAEAKRRSKRRAPVRTPARPAPPAVLVRPNTASPTRTATPIAPSTAYSRPSEFSVVYGK